MSYRENVISSLVGDMNYPKSSCGGSECPIQPSRQNWPVQKLGDTNTNNLYLRTPSQFSKISTCQNMSHVGNDQQPNLWKKDPYEIINPNFGLEYATDFFEADQCTSQFSCGDKKPKVSSLDPRLISPIRSFEPQMLDRPPYTGEVSLNKLYDKDLQDYGQHYENYKTIRGGQIQYYLDKDIDNVFHLPIDVERSNIEVDMFQTPMTSYWPQYKKTPFTRNSNYLSPQEFTRDTVRNREELMTLQRGKMLRQHYPLA